MTRIRVDLARSAGPLRKIWRYIGYDEPNYTYTPRGRELLAKIGGLGGEPYFIRCHFLLCTGDGTGSLKWGSTNVYTENEKGEPVYSWDIIDRVFDTYREFGCVPFVELGFMPLAMTSAPKGTPYATAQGPAGWRHPPVDYDKWGALIGALADHCVERYGLREVSRWYWELWNEPDIHYWAGTTQEYCTLYDHTAAAIHERHPQLLVGGPATTNPSRNDAGEFLEEFLRHCAKAGTRLDFVSFHTKGGGLSRDPAAPKQTPTIETLENNVDAGLRILGSFPQFKGLEVILSECDPDGWAAGTRADNPNAEYRNTEYYASFFATSVCRFLDLELDGPNRVDGLLTWAFEFEDREIFEGLRALSTNGVDKAVLNVFRLLEKLEPYRAAVSMDPMPDAPPYVSAVASSGESGKVTVLVVTHHDDWAITDGHEIEVELSGLPTGSYRVAEALVDGTHGNAYQTWVKQGRTPRPDEEALARLREAARLVTTQRGMLTAEDARIEIELASHAICLLTLTQENP